MKEYEGISLVCQGKSGYKILYDGSLMSGKTIMGSSLRLTLVIFLKKPTGDLTLFLLHVDIIIITVLYFCSRQRVPR